MQDISSSDFKGIDISYCDGRINFSKVKGDNIDIVYIKVTEGENLVDPMFEINYKGALYNNLLIGFYHFFTPSTKESALAQAHFFVNKIKDKKYNCKLALDLEKSNNLSKLTLSYLVNIFLKEVERLTGNEVVLYTSTSFTLYNLSNILASYSLWIAQYGVNRPRSNSIWNSWIGFQYSKSGKVCGVDNKCDLNVFTKEILLPTYIYSVKSTFTHTISNDSEYVYYTVKKGDTLGAIADEFYTTIYHLSKLNDIFNHNLIYPGQIIKVLPYSTSKVYTVKNGDTLNFIAKKFHTTVYHISKLNNITDPTLIYTGQVLKL